MNDMRSDYLSHHGIKGQKWGVRRFQNYDGTRTAAGRKRYGIGGSGLSKYQNKDGTLTEEGQKRYERDKRENLAKKKDNRIDTSSPDPNRWVREDVERSKDVVDSSNKLVNQLGNLEKATRSKPKKKNDEKTDLSQMSDQELREKINRKLLEQQYAKLYSEQSQETVSKGRSYVQSTLAVAGAVLGVASSALEIALAIQKLRSK